jgi:GxxExxY protein
MPILSSQPITAVSQEDFHRIDEQMLGDAFAIHNRFGRLLDEAIYKQELADRCAADGMTAQREVRTRVEHGSFVKDYFIDLLLCGSTIVEAKTVKELLTAHHGQGINYLLLAGTHHGSLVNFRSSRVDRKFLSTTLTSEARRQFTIAAEGWPNDDRHQQLHDAMNAFCTDVGLGLDLPLYREAFAHLAQCPRQLIPILSGPKTIGHQELTMISENTALAITGLEELSDYRLHLQRLVSNTNLSAISWINLRLGRIQLQQIKKK